MRMRVFDSVRMDAIHELKMFVLHYTTRVSIYMDSSIHNCSVAYLWFSKGGGQSRGSGDGSPPAGSGAQRLLRFWGQFWSISKYTLIKHPINSQCMQHASLPIQNKHHNECYVELFKACQFITYAVRHQMRSSTGWYMCCTTLPRQGCAIIRSRTFRSRDVSRFGEISSRSRDSL